MIPKHATRVALGIDVDMTHTRHANIHMAQGLGAVWVWAIIKNASPPNAVIPPTSSSTFLSHRVRGTPLFLLDVNSLGIIVH